MQELTVKREFAWPHLARPQREAFIFHMAWTRSRAANWALAALLHCLAAMYLLALAVILGRLAEKHYMPAGPDELSAFWRSQ